MEFVGDGDADRTSFVLVECEKSLIAELMLDNRYLYWHEFCMDLFVSVSDKSCLPMHARSSG